MASRLEIMLELERRGALPADKKPIIDELRRRGAIPGGPPAAAPEARQPFDPAGEGMMPGATAPSRMIADERELEGTGLPPGTEIVEAGRGNPGYAEAMRRSGATGKRPVVSGGRTYLAPGEPMATTVLPPDPNDPGGEAPRVEGVDSQRMLADQMAAEGIVPGEAPSAAREAAGFALDDLTGYQRALGPDFEVRRAESAGPLRGEILFRKKGTREWQSVRGAGQGGISQGDIRSIIGEVYPTLGGMGGGAAGAALPVAPGVGAITMAGLGAYAGEIMRLNEGKKRGVVPAETSDFDIMLSAMKRAGLEALGTAGGIAAYRVWKALARRGMPDLGMNEDEVLRRLEAARKKLPAEGRDLLTTGDIVADTPDGAVVRAMEDKLATQADEFGVAMRANRQAKETLTRDMLQRELPPDPSLPTGAEVGERVAKAAPNPETALRYTMGGGPEIHPDNPQIGKLARGAVARAEESAKAIPREKFEDVSAAMRGQAINPANADDTIRALEATLDERVFQKLSEEDSNLLKRWFDEAYVTIGKNERGEPIKALRPLDFDQIQNGLARIRQAKRNAYKGQWNGELETLDQIEQALIKDRDELLAAAPRGSHWKNVLSGAETQWRDLNTQFRRSLVGDFLRHRSGGAEALPGTRVTARLFNDPETSALVGKIVSRPGYEQERAAIRGMLRWEANTAAKAGQGEVSEQGIQNFVRQNQQILSNFFTPNEVNRLFNVASLQRTRRAMGIGPDMNFGKWFDSFWKDANDKNAQIVMDRLRQLDPQTALAVQGMTRQRIFDMITVEGKEATGRTMDPARFEKFIAEPGRAEWLARVMDPGLGSRLRAINEAVRTLIPASQRVNLGAGGSGADTVFAGLKKAGRLGLGILSREARIYNSLLGLAEDRVRRRAAEALLDPQRFAALVRAGRESPGGRMSAVALGQALLGDNLAAEALDR